MTATLSQVFPMIATARSRRSQGLTLGLMALALGACATAHVGAPISADRSAFIDRTSTVAKGAVQTEGGYTYNRVGDETYHAAGETIVRVGLASRVELRVHGNSFAVRHNDFTNQQGFEDARVGAKFNVVGAPDGISIVPAASVIVASSAPTGAPAFGQDAWQPEAKVALQWTLPARLTLTTNASVQRSSLGAERYSRRSGGAAVTWGASDRVAPYAGYYVVSAGAPVDQSSAYANGGVGVQVTRQVQVDARYGVGRNGFDTDYFFGLGIARRW